MEFLGADVWSSSDNMLFFIELIVIVLNLIFGVIIDTFADLRSEKQQKEEILKNTYFTCGLDRSQFVNSTIKPLALRITSATSTTCGIIFIVLVRVKDPTEFTGPESYVYAMVKVNF